MRVHGDFSVDDKAIGGIVEEFRQVVEATVANQTGLSENTALGDRD